MQTERWTDRKISKNADLETEGWTYRMHRQMDRHTDKRISIEKPRKRDSQMVMHIRRKTDGQTSRKT